jgi:hypothetical protein
MNYSIIADEAKLDEFIALLPEENEQEVYYICLFGRHKYCPEFPNTRDSGQLARITSKKEDIKNKIRRMECPVGCYVRDNIPAPQAALALYISLNPRSLIKANKEMLIELAKRFASGDVDFNPITLATTCVHRSSGRKFFIDFDFDDVQPSYALYPGARFDGVPSYVSYKDAIEQALPAGSYKILRTRGGFHLIVELEKAKVNKKFYPSITALPKCDVRGTDTLTPVPGCVQGGFVPHFV